MQTWMFFTMGLLTSASFAVLFRTPRKYFAATVLLGLGAFCGIDYLSQHLHKVYSTFAVACGVAISSQILARWSRSPAQAFLIPGLIILVPGSYLYRSFSAAMESNMEVAVREFGGAIVISCGISFAILLGNWIIPTQREL